MWDFCAVQAALNLNLAANSALVQGLNQIEFRHFTRRCQRSEDTSSHDVLWFCENHDQQCLFFTDSQSVSLTISRLLTHSRLQPIGLP